MILDGITARTVEAPFKVLIILFILIIKSLLVVTVVFETYLKVFAEDPPTPHLNPEENSLM